jgi:hypothetical protein
MTEHKIKWSHSSLKDYEGCARRYHEVKVLNNYPFQETEQTRYGKELHKAAEDYVKDGTPIPKQFEFVTPVIDALMAKPGRKFPEHEMGLTIDLKPCNFKDGDVWVRGIADLLIVDDDNLTGRIIDYKTGNNRYPDTDQLVLMSLMTFAHFPHLRQVNSALLFVVKNTIVKYRMEVEDIEPAWWLYRQRCQSSLRLLSTTLGTLRKVHCATGAQYAHANFTQNIRSKSWHVITKKNTSAI